MTDEACSKDLFAWKINNHVKANIEIVGRIMNNSKQKSEKKTFDTINKRLRQSHNLQNKQNNIETVHIDGI